MHKGPNPEELHRRTPAVCRLTRVDVTFNNGGIEAGRGVDAFFRLDTDISGSAVGTTVTPEPSTYALMAAGLAGLGFFSRRRRSDA